MKYKRYILKICAFQQKRNLYFPSHLSVSGEYVPYFHILLFVLYPPPPPSPCFMHLRSNALTCSGFVRSLRPTRGKIINTRCLKSCRDQYYGKLISSKLFKEVFQRKKIPPQNLYSIICSPIFFFKENYSKWRLFLGDFLGLNF